MSIAIFSERIKSGRVLCKNSRIFTKAGFSTDCLGLSSESLSYTFTINDMKKLSECIRKLHSMSSAFMNRLDHTPGRKVWYSFSDRKMRNEWHMQASIHYIHYNPVKHGWITDPQQWPWSSIHKFIELLGTEKLNSEAQRYDLSLYGRSWDD